MRYFFVIFSLATLALPNIAGTQNKGLAKPPKFPDQKVKLPAALQTAQSYLIAMKYPVQVSKDKLQAPYLRSATSVGSDPLELQVTLTRDQSAIQIALRLRPISDPKKISRDNLLRMFIESREFGTAHYAYDLDAKRFELRQPLFASQFSQTQFSDAITRLKKFAEVTRASWDERKW